MLICCSRAFRGRIFLPALSLAATAVCGLSAGTVIGTSWNRSEVIPVVLVKPGIGGFEPIEGASIGNTWSKDEVKAVLLVKPGIGGFEPVEGTSIGNEWNKEDVIAAALTEPNGNSFAPIELSEATGAGVDQTTAGPLASAGGTGPSVIEGQVDGEFDGWEGETIIRLTNGRFGNSQATTTNTIMHSCRKYSFTKRAWDSRPKLKEPMKP